MDPLILYYRRQAGRGREDIGPIYSTPLLVQRGQGLGSFLSSLFRSITPIFWSGAKSIGREALRTGGKILSDIAENPQAQTRDIISRHVSDLPQNIIKKLSGGGRKRKRAASSAPKSKRKRVVPSRKRKNAPRASQTIKRDIFS